MVALVFYALGEGSLPILLKEGFHFVIGTDWNPVEGSGVIWCTTLYYRYTG